MSFFGKLKSQIKSALGSTSSLENEGGEHHEQQQHHGEEHRHDQHHGDAASRPPTVLPPPSRAEFVGPFLKFVKTDLAHNANLYSVMVLVKPGSHEAPYIQLSAGAPLSLPVKLDEYDGYSFWRVWFAVPLRPTAQAVNYSINFGREHTFHIPGRDEPYKWAFTSCNGFSSDVLAEEEASLNGIKPLWTDILRDHAVKPYHAMMGGGDQVYMDKVWDDATLRPWIENPSKDYKKNAPYTAEMNKAVHKFYFDEYLKHFQLDGFREALAQIPFNFIWDDHDIFDGYGSYPDYLRLSPVMQNMFVAAQRFYLLFQHHTNLSLARKDGLIGVNGHSTVTQYGPYLAFMAVDVRTERSLTQIVSKESWDLVWQAVDNLAPSTLHLVFGATIPLVYPRLEVGGGVAAAGAVMNTVTSAIDSISSLVGAGGADGGRSALVKMFQKSAVYTNVLNSLGEPELLDDLNDHWTADNHMDERNAAIKRLQEVALRRKNLRVSFLSGDVHCCGAGKLYSADENVRSDPERDPRLMYQIVSSAIGNKPPPGAVIAMLHASSGEIVFDEQTREDMHPIFLEDLAGQPCEQKYLMAARNWARVTAPHARPDALNFEIMVECVKGDIEGKTKPYGVLVPALKA
ncbi:hypothetical protein H9P43_004324 [Blastocladiella emersonii ATCC 22665]|nr:hypothetical protein H9P43_004324 [Blastocladiella emersonii ATCC 22665]